MSRSLCPRRPLQQGLLLAVSTLVTPSDSEQAHSRPVMYADTSLRVDFAEEKRRPFQHVEDTLGSPRVTDGRKYKASIQHCFLRTAVSERRRQASAKFVSLSSLQRKRAFMRAQIRCEACATALLSNGFEAVHFDKLHEP